MIPQEAEWEPCDDLKVRKEEKKNNSELVLEMAFLKPQGACKKQNKKKNNIDCHHGDTVLSKQTK